MPLVGAEGRVEGPEEVAIGQIPRDGLSLEVELAQVLAVDTVARRAGGTRFRKTQLNGTTIAHVATFVHGDAGRFAEVALLQRESLVGF